MSEPLVSVIIPVYNGSDYLDSAINSALNILVLYNNQYEIDLSLSISTSIDENDITPFLYNSKGEDVIINKVGDTNIYKL